MNSAPLTPEQIDLLLSADLDGEFDGAAEDLGLEPAAARALLESVPGVDARREQIAFARDRLAEPVEMDELLAARLRSKALKAGADAAEEGRLEQRRRRTRLYGMVGGIAAALALVVALGASLNTTSSKSDDAASSAGASADQAPVASPTTSPVRATAGGDEGDLAELPLATAYASTDDLANDVRDRVAAFSVTAPTANAGRESSGQKTAEDAAATKCDAVADALDQGNGRALAQGFTRVAGERVSALLYLSADGRTLYFFDADCKLVNRQLIN